MTTLKRLYDIALARFEKGAFAAAENLLMQIRAQAPDDVATLHQLAKIALVQHRYDAAAVLMEKVAAVRPDRADVLLELGRIHLGTGHLRDALTCLQRAAFLCPEDGEIYRLTADVYFALKQYDPAIENASKAISLQPDDAEAHAVLGDGLLESRRPGRALECYDRSIALDADNWKVWANRGMALFLLSRLVDAKESLAFANALNPMEPGVVLPLVSVLIDLREHFEASVLLEKLSAMMPGDAKVHLLSGVNAFEQGDTKTAAAHCIKASALDENNPEIKRRLAEVLLRDGKLEPAVRILDQLINSGAPQADSYIQKAKAQLLLGNAAAAAATVDTLHAAENIDLRIPRWNGEDLRDKTILLYARFGLDELNVLIRLADVVKAKGAMVYVECTEPVRPLVDAMPSVDKTLQPGEPYPSMDYCASLEGLFGTSGAFDDNSGLPAYFSVDDGLREKWIRRFSKIEKPKIGLMWRKETHVQKDVYHSVPLSELSPLFALSDAHFVSLQTGTGLSETEFFAHRAELHSVGLENAKMDERLACISALDLIIAPDTLTAEVAAAAGLPVWVLLGTVPPWYWGLTGTQSPLFPTARLFRQSAVNRWDDVVNEVAAALGMKFLEK